MACFDMSSRRRAIPLVGVLFTNTVCNTPSALCFVPTLPPACRPINTQPSSTTRCATRHALFSSRPHGNDDSQPCAGHDARLGHDTQTSFRTARRGLPYGAGFCRRRWRQRGTATRLECSGDGGVGDDDKMQRDLDDEFERNLEIDAEAWIRGDPGRREWWERTKAWRHFQKLRRARTETLAELERDKLRYVLKDVQRLTGLPLVGKNREIKPLAWIITVVIQLMPFAALFLIFELLHSAVDTEPVLHLTRPFWS